MKFNAKILEKIIDQYHDLVLLLDAPTAKIIYANDKAQECLGYNLQEISVTEFSDIQLKFQDKDAWIKHVNEVREKEQINFEGELITRNGEKLSVEVYSQFITSGTNEYLLRIIKDISYRKSIETSLWKSKKFYQALINNSVNAVIILDEKGKYIFVNNVFEKFSGYKRKEITGRNLLELVHPEEKKEMEARFLGFVRSGQKKLALSGRFLNNNGSWRTTEGILTKLETGDGIDYILGSIKDISDKVQIEKNLFTREKFLNKILDAIPHPVWVTNWNGEFTMANEAFRCTRDNTAEDIIGKTYLDLKISNKTALAQIEKDRIQMILNEETPFYREILTDEISGQQNIHLIKQVPIERENSLELLGIAIDITELEKTRQLLVEQNQKLKKANSELDRFIYSASHELRAPLTSISGLLNIAVDEINDAEELKNYLNLIDNCVWKLTETLNEFLNFSKSTKQELPLKQVDLNIFISSIVKAFKVHKKDKGIKIIKSINQDIEFSSDPERLEIIIKNIISNSIKFYNPQTINPFIKIDVNVDKQDAFIEITDNGIGIDRKYQEKVFDMFFKASPSQSGTGLGLYNVKEAVNFLGGEIHLVSAPGLGTKVHVRVPNKVYDE